MSKVPNLFPEWMMKNKFLYIKNMNSYYLKKTSINNTIIGGNDLCLYISNNRMLSNLLINQFNMMYDNKLINKDMISLVKVDIYHNYNNIDISKKYNMEINSEEPFVIIEKETDKINEFILNWNIFDIDSQELTSEDMIEIKQKIYVNRYYKFDDIFTRHYLNPVYRLREL